ncbi:MAG: thioredoxin family protein [Alphaproteobacteria bacterium]|nr:thioredoxin family protein [Alphaproteobacteria bacterium]
MTARILALLLVAFAVLGADAHAAQPFDLKAFEGAQATGRSVLIDVRASWCPTCRRQAPIIASLQEEMPNLLVYEIDFDEDRELLRRFRVSRQSTLIMFKGDREVGRSIGDTNPASIRALVERGLQ